MQVAGAIAAAHEAGLVHRDLKPSNILIADGGQAKVVDFGLAKRFRGPDDDLDPVASITEAGLILGTAAYMSPEQTRGEDLDGRSDVFSLGSVLYEAATGQRPFQGPSVLSILHSIATSDPVPPRTLRHDLPSGFDDVIGHALEKDRNDRFASALELRDALLGLSTSVHTVEVPMAPHRRIPVVVGRDRRLGAVVGRAYGPSGAIARSRRRASPLCRQRISSARSDFSTRINSSSRRGHGFRTIPRSSDFSPSSPTHSQ